MVIRHTRIGDYLLSGDVVLEIEDSVREILEKCDGRHTVEEIAAWASKKEGECIEDVYEELEHFLTAFVENGVVVYRDSPDYIPPIYSYDRPLSVIWEITYGCNQKCKYCIVRGGNPYPDELSHEEIDTVLDELIELQVGLINITGGEPLLRKETALHIARRASENGIELELLTNGMLITPQVAQEIYDAGVRLAQVSLDSARPEIHDRQRGVKGAWKKAVEGIKNLRKVGVHVIADAVITKNTMEYYEETYNFLEELADVVNMARVVPIGRSEDSDYVLTPEMLFKLMEYRCTTEGGQLTDMIMCKDRCSIGATSVIAPNGDVYPCMFTKYPELKLGNLREKSMRSIYKSPLLHELVSCNVDKINTCRDCWNRYYCGGGCRGIAFLYHGSIYENDPYVCAARKKFARELLKRGLPSIRDALKRVIREARREV